MDRDKIASANQIIDKIDNLNNRIDNFKDFISQSEKWTAHDDKGGFKVEVTGKGVSAITIKHLDFNKVVETEVKKLQQEIESLENQLKSL